VVAVWSHSGFENDTLLLFHGFENWDHDLSFQETFPLLLGRQWHNDLLGHTSWSIKLRGLSWV